MKRLIALVALVVAIAAPQSIAAASDHSTTYYLSLGDSLAEGFQPNGDLTHGYAEQLHTALATDNPKLELVKLGCGGESTSSMRFGSQLPTVVLSCGTPRYYNSLFPKGTQLAEAVSFLKAHKGKVELVTIDLGANDIQRFDADFNLIVCLFEDAGCGAQEAAMSRNLAAILAELRAAAGADVPIVGMTYYNAFAPLLDPVVDTRLNELNGVLASTYGAASVPVADVAGAFHNGQPDSVEFICGLTWVCTLGDLHPNTAGYDVIADEFLKVLP
jgi:lysophospholipase L1-like esterase